MGKLLISTTLGFLMLAPPINSHADAFSKEVIYKCVKDGKTTFQEMPCGWSSRGYQGDASAKNTPGQGEQFIVPMADFCSDENIPKQDELKKRCLHFDLPKESR